MQYNFPIQPWNPFQTQMVSTEKWSSANTSFAWGLRLGSLLLCGGHDQNSQMEVSLSPASFVGLKYIQNSLQEFQIELPEKGCHCDWDHCQKRNWDKGFYWFLCNSEGKRVFPVKSWLSHVFHLTIWNGNTSPRTRIQVAKTCNFS